jgi:hypothetical protein
VAQLTGLTKLELHPFTLGYWLFCASEQSELGSALAALSRLRSLLIDHAPPGPVAEALSQLTALTELCLMQQQAVPKPGPLILPIVKNLTFLMDSITAQHLVCITAPQLQHLKSVWQCGPLTCQTSGGYARGCSGHATACPLTYNMLAARRRQPHW